MKKLISMIGGCLLICAVASASNNSYEIGYVNSDGYTWKGDGYWYWKATPYSRAQEAYTYYQYGYPYYSYRYVYTEVSQPAVVETPTYTLPSVKDPAWKEKLLDIAKQRDQIEGAKQLTALDNAAYMQALKALGLEGNFYFQNYGQSVAMPYSPGYAPGYSNYSQHQLGHFGVQGQTLYGYDAYAFQTIQDLFGDTALLNQAYALATQNQQQYASQAVGGLGALADKQGSWVAKVADTLARGQAAKAALLGAQGNSSHSQSTTVVTTPNVQVQPQPQILPPNGGVGQVGPPQAAPALDFSRQNSFFKANCVACHGAVGGDGQLVLKGKLDLRDWGALTSRAKLGVLHRITTEDDKLRMPRTVEGGPGNVISEDELRNAGLIN